MECDTVWEQAADYGLNKEHRPHKSNEAAHFFENCFQWDSG
jgi:hypothetical protein